MEEMVHRPPAVLASRYPDSTKPLSRYLVAAPRCYAFLTHFPFFALHMKVVQVLAANNWLRKAFACVLQHQS